MYLIFKRLAILVSMTLCKWSVALGSFVTLRMSQTVRENVNDDDYDRIWKEKVFFICP